MMSTGSRIYSPQSHLDKFGIHVPATPGTPFRNAIAEEQNRSSTAKKAAASNPYAPTDIGYVDPEDHISATDAANEAAQQKTGTNEDDPEYLVLGAILSCPKGTLPGILIVVDDSKTIKGLPVADITDRVPIVNITPFGLCRKTKYPLSPCDLPIETDWYNPGGQDEYKNKKEIITINSALVCTRGEEIEPLTSGQSPNTKLLSQIMDILMYSEFISLPQYDMIGNELNRILPDRNLAKAPDLDIKNDNAGEYNCFGSAIGKKTKASPDGFNSEKRTSVKDTFEGVKKSLGFKNVREFNKGNDVLGDDEFLVAMSCGMHNGRWDFHFNHQVSEGQWYNKPGSNSGYYIYDEGSLARAHYGEIFYFALKKDWDK